MKKELKNLEHSSHTIALSNGSIFAKKRCFLQKMLILANLRGAWD